MSMPAVRPLNLIRRALSRLPYVDGFGRRTVATLRRVSPVRLGVLAQYRPRPLMIPRERAARPVPCPPPKITIVTPSFQHGAYIEHTIKSVLDQRYPNLEYFVQDGGSTDETPRILRRYETALAGWESRSDRGQAEALNRGFSRSTGDIMAWLNSDDMLLPGTLATVAGFFAMHPDVDVVYGDRIVIDEDGMEIGRWVLPPHDSAILSWADFVPQETLFWRRSIWTKVGAAIDESFQFAMDWDLLVRFRDAGASFAHLPCFMGVFRAHALQKTAVELGGLGRREEDRIRERIFGRIPRNIEIDRAKRPYLRRHLIAILTYRLRRICERAALGAQASGAAREPAS
jgi:glycosyltransferase involved in cell wall biosynthesis